VPATPRSVSAFRHASIGFTVDVDATSRPRPEEMEGIGGREPTPLADGESLRTLRGEMCRGSPSSITVSYSGESPDDEPPVCFVRVLRDGTG
jgi:hypothetical protein